MKKFEVTEAISIILSNTIVSKLEENEKALYKIFQYQKESLEHIMRNLS